MTLGPALNLSGSQVLVGQMGTITLSPMIIKPAWDNDTSPAACVLHGFWILGQLFFFFFFK